MKQSLSPMEQRLVKLLRWNKDEIVPYSKIISTLWGTNGKTFQIHELTKRVRDKRPDLPIHTITAKGLMFSESYKPSVELSPLENTLRNVLTSRRGEIVPYSEIANSVWAGGIVSKSSIRVLLNGLRTKCPDLNIRTITKVGLRLDE